MKQVTKKEYDKICSDYKGIYLDFQGNRPDLKGRKTMLSYENGSTVLLIEGLHFEII